MHFDGGPVPREPLSIITTAYQSRLDMCTKVISKVRLQFDNYNFILEGGVADTPSSRLALWGLTRVSEGLVDKSPS